MKLPQVHYRGSPLVSSRNRVHGACLNIQSEICVFANREQFASFPLLSDVDVLP